MKVAIRQVRGNSGIDVWAANLCHGMKCIGIECAVELFPSIYQFLPIPITRLHQVSRGCDIIQGNSWNGFAFKGDLPLIVTDHGVVNDPEFNKFRSYSQKIYHRWIHHCEEKTLKVSDKVVCVSQNASDCFEYTFGFSDADVIYNGIDQSFFKPFPVNRIEWKIPADKVVLFYSGNLSRRKGIDLLPEIMKNLGEKFILLTTLGKRQQSVLQSANSMNLGYLNLHQLVTIYNLCDIFIIPSRLEGFSLSVLEAMACGKPVIASDCSSFAEQIMDGQGGFLCRKGDAEDFSEKIRYLSENEEIQKQMGRFNRNRVIEKFQLDSMVKQYIKLYQSI